MDVFFVIAYPFTSDYETGGLNLNAAHFAQLSELSPFFICYWLTEVSEIVALMSLVQIVYQFYLYPYVVFVLFFILRLINLPL
jgi:hypothetical protein